MRVCSLVVRPSIGSLQLTLRVCVSCAELRFAMQIRTIVAFHEYICSRPERAQMLAAPRS